MKTKIAIYIVVAIGTLVLSGCIPDVVPLSTIDSTATTTPPPTATDPITTATSAPTDKPTEPIPTSPPTNTPLPPEPSIPTNYDLFDDFSGSGSIDANRWIAVGKFENCSNQQDYGVLYIKCETFNGDVNLGFLPIDENLQKIPGVAVATNVLTDDYLGSMGLNISFIGANNEERVYFLQLRQKEFKVSEIYPQTNWEGYDLAKVSVASGKPHVIRAEYDAGLFIVWIDDTQIQMEPNLPNNAIWLNWKIEPFVACQDCIKGVLETNLLWVAYLHQ